MLDELLYPLPASPEVSMWRELAAAAQRLRIAQAVLDQVSHVDLACEELNQAERAYLRLREPH
jgi:hypothetical protein